MAEVRNRKRSQFQRPQAISLANFEHHAKNPFNKSRACLLGTGFSAPQIIVARPFVAKVIEPKMLDDSDDDEDQATERMNWDAIVRPIISPVAVVTTEPPVEAALKRFSTTPVKIAESQKTEPDAGSAFAAAIKANSDRDMEPDKVKEEAKCLKMTLIGEEEFGALAGALRTSVRLSEFMKEQFRHIATLPGIAPATLEKLAVKLPAPRAKKLTNKTAVFDLDNTLVFVATNETLAKLKIPRTSDVKTVIYVEPKQHRAIQLNVIIRPYAVQMLAQLAPYYELVVFTAANKIYADTVLGILDPSGTLFDYRIYRDSCIRMNNCFVKDLRILNRDLASVSIVDDSIVAFSSQLENGICVPPFNGNRSDAELAMLWIFLRQIIDANDIRVPIVAKYNIPFYMKMYQKGW